mmetsp:Transcript_11071/g.13063  ORF Transcript_11071/g.13063 Transcript_11071/m.13063 type:complete len:88 (+) Transcript_11071:203-466(+)
MIMKLVQTCKVATLVDFLESVPCSYFVFKTLGDHTLQSVVAKVYPEGCDIEFAQSTIASVATILDSLHRRGIVHRRIYSKMVGMKLS